MLPVTTYMYRRRGQPLRIPTPGKRVSPVAVIGAMRWPDGPFLFSHGKGYPNTARFVEMLRQLELHAKRTGKRVVVVIDNASAHTSKISQLEIERIRPWIRVFWLPTYTSEQLNDIEWLWKHIKEDYFSRMLVKDRKDFQPAAVELLSSLRRGKVLRRMLKPRHIGRVCKKLIVPA